MACEMQLEIVGLLKTHHFHAAKSIAEGLKQKFPTSFADPIIRPLLESDWHVYITNKRKELRGVMWQYPGLKYNVACFVSGSLLGDEKQLRGWAEKHWTFTFYRPQALYMALAQECYTQHLHSTGHVFVYMDVMIGDEAVGRMLFELFSDLCPKTCENFKALCTGEAHTSRSNLTLCYKDSLLNRVVPNGWVQGGDITGQSRGNGGESIYGPTFEDENFSVSHNKRGILGMANRGPHTNSSQLYITLQPALWMDKKYVAFGQVVEGTEVLRRLEEVPTYNERPKQDCKIVTCGLYGP
ncbi:probable inactive peptidyl-prolyl cis-trans isomerase-like 6 [Ictalurus punctatus]|uniref:Peptidyl-prolyl cis-trans isomerase n=1 Tax=Ictalurus punctatus TaxID=7998 RepID=E3TF63_ICTPU|nr:probable inactive peptidyl-prolyl cis-trans isomerase-like 6 [Ictalurus punctatus]ADO28949.1 peptidyl-prolyl cis-trans isomerase-like 6 [Ictalurus punctatus]